MEEMCPLEVLDHLHEPQEKVHETMLDLPRAEQGPYGEQDVIQGEDLP